MVNKIEISANKNGSGRVVPKVIEEEMKRAYIDYAMSVIVSRALPDVRDGLKPVHRRIIYSMDGLGLVHNKPHRKSARIVGECFVKDTLVLTDQGLIPIQDVGKGDCVITQKGRNRVKELYMMPKRELLKVVLSNGSYNLVTKSQRFKVINENLEYEWKKAKDLTKEDYVVVRSYFPQIEKCTGLPIFEGKKKLLNKNIAYLLGQLISDGWVERNYNRGKSFRVSFCSNSVSVINKVHSILKKEFNYLGTIEKNNQKDLKVIRINNLKLNRYLVDTFSLENIGAPTKRVPKQIFKSPKTIIFSFISGLIDGDGSIHKNRNVVHYGTVSEELSKQLLILLQHLGVHGALYRNKAKKGGLIKGKAVKRRRPCFNLEFRGANALELAKNLDLVEKRKSNRVKNLLKRKIGQSNYNLLPYGEKVFEELTKSHLGGGWYKDFSDRKFRSGIKYPKGSKIRYCKYLHSRPIRVSQIVDWGIQKKLQRIGGKLCCFLENISKDGIFFLKVNKIEDCGKDITYDIQVEKDHEFIANGMLSHNCMGKYHPHGDVSVYDALVRMAQEFSLRYPLVDGQGNFGSIDGDSAAAQRYTEARLKKIAEEMLQDIEKNTVKFIPNFDNSLEEPTVLPSKLPNLLVNGSSGIAVGMATNIPPHNLNEVCSAVIKLIENPNISVNEICEIIKGPDFPTAGIIAGKRGILEAYATGRGLVRVRGKVETEEDQIIVNEIPYMVNKSLLVEQIAELIKNKTITGISDLRDESDRDGLRIVIELKKGTNQEVVLNQLFKHSRLQTTFGINIVALVNNEPKTLNIKELIQHFVNHRKEVVTKRTQFDLSKAENRAHILEGVIIALKNIDAVVQKIKKSKDIQEAQDVLKKDYSLTDIQTKAILDMRLQKLASLEQKKIREEYDNMLKLIEELKSILASEKKIFDIIKKELAELKDQYGDERRTTIVEAEEEDLEVEDLIAEEEVIVTITHAGYTKRTPIDTYKQQKRGGKGIIATGTKEEDFVEDIFIANTHSYILFFTNKGQVYWLKVYKIPEASRQAKGSAIINLLNLGKEEKVTAFIPVKEFDESHYLIMATKSGIVKKTNLSSYSRPRAGGIRAITLNGDELVNVKITDGTKQVILATENGMAVKFHEKNVRPMGRTAAGVRGIKLRKGDKVVEMVLGEDEKTLLTVTENGYGKRTGISEYRLINRGGSGVKNIICSDRNGKVVSITTVEDSDELMFISKNGIAIRIPASGISVIGRNTQGVRIMKLEEGDKVVAAAKIVND